MKPNILFITTDQQRRNSLPCYGAGFMRTPNLDRLAAEGQVYENAYSASPVCQPVRAAFMTGQYPSLTGVGANAKWLRPESPTIAREFDVAGWNTAAIGKMHFYPFDNAEGFRYRMIAEDKRHIYLNDDWTIHLHKHGYKRFHPSQIEEYRKTGCSFANPLPENLHVDGFIGDEAVKWVESTPEEPFFSWISFNSPHDPYDPPESFASLYDEAEIPAPLGSRADVEGLPDYLVKNLDQWGRNPLFQSNFDKIPPERALEWRRKYFATISFIDKQIGKILDALERRGILDKTLIIFSSDHGDLLGDHGLPFKCNFYEGSVGVPLIIRGPGVQPGSRISDRLSWIDLHATIFAAAGLDLPEYAQGQDFSGLWRDPSARVCDTAYAELDEAVMLQRGRYKLVRVSHGGGTLYDTDADPEERQNLYDNPTYATVRREFEEEILTRRLRQTALPRYGGGKHPPIPERGELFTQIKSGAFDFDSPIICKE